MIDIRKSQERGHFNHGFRGPEGAHGIRNETDETARVLMFSTVVYPTATVYPDSDKVGVWVGDPEVDMIVHRSSAVEYYDGEV